MNHLRAEGFDVHSVTMRRPASKRSPADEAFRLLATSCRIQQRRHRCRRSDREMTHDDWRWVIDVDFRLIRRSKRVPADIKLSRARAGVHRVLAGLVPNAGLGAWRC